MAEARIPAILPFSSRARRVNALLLALTCAMFAVAIHQRGVLLNVDRTAWGSRLEPLVLALSVALLVRCLCRSRRRGIWLVAGALIWVGGHLPLALASESSAPLMAHYAHGIASLLCAIGLIQFCVAAPPSRRPARAMSLIDFPLTVAGLGTAAWFFMGVPALQSGAPLADLSRLALRTGADLILLAVLLVVMPRLTRAWGGSWLLRLVLGGGLSVVAAADLFSPTSILEFSATASSPAAITAAGFFALLLLGSLDRRRAQRAPTPTQAPVDGLEPIWRVLLMVGLIGLVGTLVVWRELSDRLDPYGAPVLFGAMLTIGFAVLRLTLALREARRMARFLSHQVDRDPLTELLNNRAGHERAAEALAWANATQRASRRAAPVSLALIDVDNFKAINDEFGHQAGDIVLRALADLLKGHCRSGDLAVRYAGDEFLLILPGMGSTAAWGLGARILSEVRSRQAGWIPAGGYVSLSIGVAVSHGQRPAPQIIAVADAAMYDAKHAGKDRVLVTDADTLVTLPATQTRPIARFLRRQSPLQHAG
ncbi:MAG: GGDEF domain-containing protein [Chloroflexota bacterium]|nr:GGDEF domain-containing protein [Chloroflexota bacterium]